MTAVPADQPVWTRKHLLTIAELSREDADGLLQEYRQRLTHYTYLD